MMFHIGNHVIDELTRRCVKCGRSDVAIQAAYFDCGVNTTEQPAMANSNLTPEEELGIVATIGYKPLNVYPYRWSVKWFGGTKSGECVCKPDAEAAASAEMTKRIHILTGLVKEDA